MCCVATSDPRCFLPVTMCGTTHAHLLHMCWPLLASMRKSLHTCSLCLHQWRVPPFALKYPCNPPPPPGDRHLATVSPPPPPGRPSRANLGVCKGGGGYHTLPLNTSVTSPYNSRYNSNWVLQCGDVHPNSGRRRIYHLRRDYCLVPGNRGDTTRLKPFRR